MKIENQVCTLEQAKKLKELDVRPYSMWVWVPPFPVFNSETRLVLIGEFQNALKSSILSEEAKKLVDSYPAFTVAELGVMLPNYYESHKGAMDDTWYCVMLEGGDGEYFAIEKTESEARADVLIYLLENNLTTAEEVNQRLTN